jgi:hypothetical protein
MQKILDWAALPPPAKLCLMTAHNHHGLLKTDDGYVGRSDTSTTPARFSAVVVAILMREGLATAHTFDDRLVQLTDAALVLLHLGRATVEVAA